MEENTEQPNQAEEEVLAQGGSILLSDAMTGVFTEPGETFDAVKSSSKKNYWIIPILIFIAVTLIASYLVLNDEELFSEIKSKQTEAVKKRLDEAVKEGRMTKEQMNESLEQVDRGFNKSSPIFIVFTVVGPVVTTFLALFIKGLIFLGVLKIFKGTATYMQILSVFGLTALIDSIQVIVSTVFAILTGKLYSTLGPVLLFSKDAVGESMVKFLAHFDIINIWYLVVVGIGLAKVSGLKGAQTITTVFVLWLVWVCLTSFLKIPFLGM